MTGTAPLTGGCLCGALRYEIEGEPVFTGQCACDNCRKGSGVEHASLFAVPAAAARTEGTVARYAHGTDSGAEVTRHFCPICGSFGWSTNSRMPDMMFFAAGSLDDMARFRPGIFVYAAKRAPWDKAGSDLPCFDAMPPADAAP